MKRILGVTFILAVLALSVATARTFQNANVAGSWDVTIDSPQGQRTVVMVIKKDGDKLTGAMKGQAGERPLDSVVVKGDDVKFSIKISAQGQNMTVNYAGKITGKDSMKGTAAFGELGEGTWTAKRK